MNKNIFISFVEEAVLNPDYQGYVGGRVEVQHPGDGAYPSEEIRFFTKNVECFYAFRDGWDMNDITLSQLEYLRRIIQNEYNES